VRYAARCPKELVKGLERTPLGTRGEEGPCVPLDENKLWSVAEEGTRGRRKEAILTSCPGGT